MEERTYNLYLKDSLFDPNSPEALQEKKASYKKYSIPDAKMLYKVWVYLEGRDIPFVQSVRYHLHHSFRIPNYLVERNLRNPNFSLVIWTWGVFNLKAEINLISGETIMLSHYLTYGDEINVNKIEWSPVASGSSQII